MPDITGADFTDALIDRYEVAQLTSEAGMLNCESVIVDAEKLSCPVAISLICNNSLSNQRHSRSRTLAGIAGIVAVATPQSAKSSA